MTEGAERPPEGAIPETTSSATEAAASATPVDGSGAPLPSPPAEAAATSESPTPPGGTPRAVAKPAVADAAPGGAPSPASAPADAAAAAVEDELARSEREAAEALRTGAFEGSTDTVRMRRDELHGARGPSPLVRGAVPALDSHAGNGAAANDAGAPAASATVATSSAASAPASATAPPAPTADATTPAAITPAAPTLEAPIATTPAPTAPGATTAGATTLAATTPAATTPDATAPVPTPVPPAATPGAPTPMGTTPTGTAPTATTPTGTAPTGTAPTGTTPTGTTPTGTTPTGTTPTGTTPTGTTPEVAPAETPTPSESPLAAIKRAIADAKGEGAPSAATPEAATSPSPLASAPAAVAPSQAAIAVTAGDPVPAAPTKPEPAEPSAPTEKFDRAAIAAKAPAARDAQRVRGEPDRAAEAARSSAKLKAMKPRSEEDDRLLGALLFLDSPTAGPEKPPSPFATIAGVSLLKRAAASVRAAAAPRVLLGGLFEPDVLEKARVEFAKAGFAGTLETWTPHTPLPFGERGRILILDAAGVHDPEAVARLARWKGERACVLVADEGDGLRVQVENGKVKEVGASLVPFDGVTCGAVNVPLTLFSRLTELGALGALVALAREGLLAASVERRTFAREITSETGLSEARQRLLDRASGGANDSLLNRYVHRKLSRPLTSVLLPLGVPPTALTVASGVVGLLGAALLSGCGMAPGVPVLALGVLLLFGSIVLDCASDELAALGMRDSKARRVLGQVLDGVIAVAAVLGLGVGAKLLKVEDGITYGGYAAIGVGLASLLAMVAGRGDTPPASDTVSLGVDLLAARIRNRDVTYLMLAIVAAHGIMQVAGGEDAKTKALWIAIVALPAIAHAFWVALAVLIAFRPRS